MKHTFPLPKIIFVWNFEDNGKNTLEKTFQILSSFGDRKLLKMFFEFQSETSLKLPGKHLF